ncbi:hypothetical protein HPB49_004219 [Dermacentor silvarum]|uniref:Uncharacterized protein n=1 Tax=Dermacentor silvarum TaxID=543639 RepID=A0ACB8CV70_DERSI|nr:hypothetical protein HPB49_004219 [Dermacentor silvarum]
MAAAAKTHQNSSIKLEYSSATCDSHTPACSGLPSVSPCRKYLTERCRMVSLAIGGPQTQDYRIRIQPEVNLIAIDAWNPSLILHFLGLTTIQDRVRNFAFRLYEATPLDHPMGIFHGFDVKDDGPRLLVKIACWTHKPVAARPLDSQDRSVLVTFAGPTLPRFITYRLHHKQITPFRPNATVCTRCYLLGHTHDVCPTETPCFSTCGCPPHRVEIGGCHKPPIWINCQGPHIATDNSCTLKKQLTKQRRSQHKVRIARHRQSPPPTRTNAPTAPTNHNSEIIVSIFQPGDHSSQSSPPLSRHTTYSVEWPRLPHHPNLHHAAASTSTGTKKSQPAPSHSKVAKKANSPNLCAQTPAVSTPGASATRAPQPKVMAPMPEPYQAALAALEERLNRRLQDKLIRLSPSSLKLWKMFSPG